MFHFFPLVLSFTIVGDAIVICALLLFCLVFLFSSSLSNNGSRSIFLPNLRLDTFSGTLGSEFSLFNLSSSLSLLSVFFDCVSRDLSVFFIFFFVDDNLLYSSSL